MNGEFKRCAQELQRHFPGLRIEGGPYTPPASVQYGIRAVRFGQVAVAAFFFFGEQLLAAFGRPPFDFMTETQTSVMVHAGVLYGLDLIAQTLKSINAFEVVYNGRVLHSKLKSGKFPGPGVVSNELRAVQAAQARTTHAT